MADREIERLRLHYKCEAENADKIYEIAMYETGGGGYKVIGYNGRRGSKLTPQPKTRFPVSHREAERIFERTKNEKLFHKRTPYKISAASPSMKSQMPPITKPDGNRIEGKPAHGDHYEANFLEALEL